MILGLIGATGAVGEEVLALLGAARLPIAELRVFASEDSAGLYVDFFDEELRVEPAEAEALARCDLLICAAPLEPSLLSGLRGSPLVDLSGALEDDPEVPLIAGSLSSGPRDARVVAAARGITVGTALVLHALAAESEIARATITTLEGAGGAGRRGLDALSEQTVQMLNAMDGAPDEAGVFPRALAFDVLPQVGRLQPDGTTHEEARMATALRRLLPAPALDLEITRVRVPIFLGSLAVLNLEFHKDIPIERARERLEALPEVELLSGDEIPTPRGAVGSDPIAVGRLRAEARGLSLVLAQDDLRHGAARTALDFVKAQLRAS